MNRIALLFVPIAVFAMFSCGGGKKARQAGTVAGTRVELSDSLLSLRRADTVRFSGIREGEVLLKELTLFNSSDSPVVITKIDSPCSCVIFEYNREPIMPGGEKTLKLYFDSAGYTGFIERKASVYTTLSPLPLMFVIEAEIK